MLPIVFYVLALITQKAPEFDTDNFFEVTDTYKADPTLMASILYCESRGDPKAKHFNKNGTTDHSLMQVNDIHKKEALKMGLSIDNPKDNLAYGAYLITKNNASDYSASKSCWLPLLHGKPIQSG